MFELFQRIPEPWRQLADLLIAPLVWIPRMQHAMWDFFSAPGPWYLIAGKYIFLVFPALLAVAAVWCTQLSLYTLPFRSGRVQFIPTMMLTWWDAARAVWVYWVGMFRFVGVALGWAVTFSTFVVKLLLEIFRQVVLMPFTMTGRMTQTYFRPGVPWVAFVMLVFWCALEAAIFSYTLMPTVTELLTDLVGGESTAHYTTPILYCFLLLLVMGSFACVQSLMDAMKKREWKSIIQMVIVELFVMFFEVMFLYRELIDALTPWISQQTGMKMGLTVTLSLSAFGWIGIRGMTWFLFGQYGTPPMLAFISRQPIGEEGEPRLAHRSPGRGRSPQCRRRGVGGGDRGQQAAAVDALRRRRHQRILPVRLRRRPHVSRLLPLRPHARAGRPREAARSLRDGHRREGQQRAEVLSPDPRLQQQGSEADRGRSPEVVPTHRQPHGLQRVLPAGRAHGEGAEPRPRADHRDGGQRRRP